MRRKSGVKAEVIQMVARSPLPVRQTLKELKVSSATYYRWRRRYAERGMEGLQDLLPRARRVWNRLRDEERGFIVAYALEHPSLSAREVAARLVDREGRFVSESTVYRVLREATRVEVEVLKREGERLRELVANLSVENLVLKKSLG